MEGLRFTSRMGPVGDFLELTDMTNVRMSKDTLYKWTEDVVNKLTFKPNLVHKVALKQIEDNRVVLSDTFNNMVQVLYKEDKQETVRRSMITQFVDTAANGCEVEINLDCPECVAEDGIEVDVDYWYEFNHPQRYFDKFVKTYGGLQNTERPIFDWQQDFRIMRSAQHNFFNADYHIPGCVNLNQDLLADEVGEYKIDFPLLLTNIRSGWVVLSYLEYKTDDEGYRLVPDIPEVHEAIVAYLQYKFFRQRFHKTRDRSYLQDGELFKQEYERAMGRARQKLKMPSVEEVYSTYENVVLKMHSNPRNSLNRWKRDGFDSKMSRLTRR